ncbi:MAG: molybdenum cofactor biosynthesis protein MoaE [Pseudomonadota bacterium]
MRVRVQSEPFDPGASANGFAADVAGAGAIVTFTGLVRGTGGILAMRIEHYPAMTEKAIAAMMDQAAARWDLLDALVIHRFGLLVVGAPIMMVATAATHRVDAFAAADFLMDYLKSRAPFWKQEITAEGAKWVASTDRDEAALRRW